MKSRRTIISLVGLTTALLAGGCGAKSSTRPALETALFEQRARGIPCADLQHRLFVIDESMVLLQRAGKCPDNSYASDLYGRSPAEILCTMHDSIAGPMTHCEAGAPRELFETMTRNLDSPDLGLGPDHKVRSVPL